MPKRGHINDSGGPNAPRFPNKNIDWTTLRDKYLIPELRKQKAPNTIRGLMYILKAKGILKKSDYDGLDTHLVYWRLDGSIDRDDIADGSGRSLLGDFDPFEEPGDWIDGHVDALKNATKEYHKLLKN